MPAPKTTRFPASVIKAAFPLLFPAALFAAGVWLQFAALRTPAPTGGSMAAVTNEEIGTVEEVMAQVPAGTASAEASDAALATDALEDSVFPSPSAPDQAAVPPFKEADELALSTATEEFPPRSAGATEIYGAILQRIESSHSPLR